MGNCQAVEAATVVIQHPEGNKVEKIHRSVSALEVMNSNPGYYVALVVISLPATTSSRAQNGVVSRPSMQLKLLRSGDTLLIGHVYRLISFEDVLKGFVGKKCIKLGKLLTEGGAPAVDAKRKDSGDLSSSIAQTSMNDNRASFKVDQLGINSSSSSSSGYGRGIGRHRSGMGQWKTALQSISETGS